MRMLSKYAACAVLAGALAFAAATPSLARWHGHGWHYGAAAAGFGVGVLVGAAAANAAYPGYCGYAYAPGYAYGPHTYEPAYAPSYAPGNAPSCAGDLGYGRLDYSAC